MTQDRHLPLLPCPFCGSEAQQPENYGAAPNFNGRFVECKVCHASIWRHRTTTEEADAALAEAWNTRVTHKDLIA